MVRLVCGCLAGQTLFAWGSAALAPATSEHALVASAASGTGALAYLAGRAASQVFLGARGMAWSLTLANGAMTAREPREKMVGLVFCWLLSDTALQLSSPAPGSNPQQT